jgi:hypothetical protein
VNNGEFKRYSLQDVTELIADSDSNLSDLDEDPDSSDNYSPGNDSVVSSNDDVGLVLGSGR